MNNLFNENKADIVIKLLKQYEPVNGYHVAFSGGKDSIVLYDLCVKAKVKFQTHYNITTVDPPELTRFIHKEYPDVKWLPPVITMRQAIIKKQYPPTRIVRYCCQFLKEWYRPDGIMLMGIRKKESTKRGKRNMFEMLHKSGTFSIFPMFEWDNNEIWEYIKINNLKVCSLYDEGYKRLGCVMCPQKGSKGMKADAERWPKIANNYKKWFQEMFDHWTAKGKSFKNWKSGNDIYEWWITEPKKKTQKEVLF